MTGFGDFRFADPQWGLALWGVLALVAFASWRSRSDDRALSALIAPALQATLLRRASPARRTFEILLFGIACAALVLALMRPQWGSREIAATQVSAELMIALDVSKSMLAEDVTPNRLERAKAEIIDLLPYLEGDQVGLIAFAGRASVLSPLTPDFGFLRLALENAGPHSVTRGGTRLEEPIRRAVAGFGPPGASQRALLLITDGEDHDSFVRDAATEAAEAGVTIIAIGFGDEAGSPIQVRDPRTGARRVVVDGDGVPVRSRLDGELLREIALTTEGAYVPAGTGVLDLESIYANHLAQLVRGGGETRGRIVRDEGYPWCLLVALCSLLAAVVLRSRPIEVESDAGAARGVAAILLVALLLAGSEPARAQTAAGEDLESLSVEAVPEAEASESPEESDTRTSRERYNDALAKLGLGEPAEAAREFADARREAPSDPELRYHTTYNLGMAASAVAEQRRSEDPQAALNHLHEAADWFRQAVELRPEDEASRHNLEVTLIEALALEDELARQNEKSVDAELEALATAQRELGAAVGSLVEAVARADDTNAADSMRPAFRASATSQRETLSDSDALAARASAERTALDEVPEAERSPENAVRAAQLDGVLHYLHRARERMGQTRRDLRRRQPVRAYRRAIASATELERARDQLRTPDALIDVLLRESSGLARRTEIWAGANVAAGRLDPTVEKSELPVWLGAEALAEEQSAIAERTGELDLRLLAGLEQAALAQPAPEEAVALEALQNAEPLLARAAIAQKGAAESIEQSAHEAALLAQAEAIQALADAREFFLEFPRLIELAYTDERRIEVVVDEHAEALGEWAEALLHVQERNLARVERIDEAIDREIARAQAELSAGDPPEGPGPAEQGPPPEERIALFNEASRLLTQVREGMAGAQRGLAVAGRLDPAPLSTSVRRATRSLAELRRLFMTLAQQVQELAAEQQALGEATQEAVILGAADDADPSRDSGAATRERLAPLLPQQGRLAERGVDVANDLAAQSDAQGDVQGGVEAADAGGPGATAPQGGVSTEDLRRAAEHVLGASTSMEEAESTLGAAPPDADAGRGAQAAALESLAEALALLQPPQEEQDQPEDDSGEGEQDQEQQNQPQQEEPQLGDNEDLARALQNVRDREAERQRDRAARQAAESETVERDW